MANGDAQSGDAAGQVKLFLTVISTFGLGSLLVVVIGRLWTIAYFDHFGLSTEDLEFTTQDFAFRSLEVLISLGLAGFGLLAAFHVKSILREGDRRFLAGEIVAVAAAIAFMVWGLGPCVDRAARLTNPGVLGVISGVALTFMVFLVADIWFGEPSGKPLSPPANVPRRRGALKPTWDRLKEHGNQIVAGMLVVGILFIYLPLITGHLADIQAEVDLKKGRLPVAILETTVDPLPGPIASDDDPTKSNLVRVILAQSDNTYVLNSTQCKTIGESGEQVEKTLSGTTISRNANLCKVFAIPTRRLESIEYRSVKGNPPPHDAPSLAARIGLRQPFEPFEAIVSTRGADDDKHISCQGQEPGSFRHTVWYEVTPPDEGVLLVRADSLTRDLLPVIGVWRDSGEAVPERDAAPGSGAGGRACELKTVTLPSKAARSLGAPKDAQRVGTLANLQANDTYLIGLGANENTAGRTEGEFRVFIQFFPDGSFLATNVEPNVRPEIEFRSTLGRVTLELRHFGKDYALRSLQDCVVDARDICVFVGRGGVRELRDDHGQAVVFSVESEEGAEVTFRLVNSDDVEPEHTALEAQGILGAGTWQLTNSQLPPPPIVASLVIPTFQPNLILAIEGESAAPEGTAGPPVDAGEARTALMAVLDLVQIRTELQLEGPLAFALPSEALAALGEEQGELSRLRTILDALSVQIDAVEQRQLTLEEQGILRDAANLVQKQLEDVGVAASVGECGQMCIRIFFIRLQPQSDMLSEQQPPPNGQETVPSE